MAEENDIHWADILVFTVVLLISAAIGLFYALRARRVTAEELLLGDRKLPVIPVIFSLSVSFVSSASVLGIPAEIYFNGLDYWMVGFGFAWALAITAIFLLPIFYRLHLTSAYEYLELRFNKHIRLMASAVFITLMLCYMAVVLYAPALALSQVTGLSMEVSILTIGLICTLYTGLGGIKAVIWTDAFQTVVITTGLLALIGRGTVEVGGVAAVANRVVNGSRDATFPMGLDPFIRHTFWTLTIGGGFGVLAIYGANQATLQRYISVDTLTKSRMVLFLNIPLAELYLALMCLSGAVMFAYYDNEGQNPLKDGRVKKADQLIPLFVTDIFREAPGMPGLFIACIFSASLSTVSSGVNAQAAVVVEDFIKPVFLRFRGVRPDQKTSAYLVIATGLALGLVTVGAAYIAGLLGSTLLTIVVSIFGMMGGPLLGLILIGMFCPWVNSWGAGCALVSSLILCMWTAIGAITRTRPSPSPVNGTSINATQTMPTILTASNSWDVNDWYDMSYQHYSTLGVIISLIVGTLVSALTKCNLGRALHKGTYYDVFRRCRKADLQELSYSLAAEKNQGTFSETSFRSRTDPGLT